MSRIFRQDLRFQRTDGLPFEKWETVPLSRAAEINPRCRSLPTNFEYIELGGVERGVLVSTTKTSLTTAPDRAQRFLKIGDILFQSVRPNLMNNLLFNRSGAFVASTGFAQLRASEHQEYLYHVIHSPAFQREVIRRCTGTGYPAINASDLSGIPIPLPSIDEQAKIAAALSALDAKIDAVAAQIERMEIFRRGLIQGLFP